MSFFSGGGTGVGTGLVRIGAVTSGLKSQVRGAMRDVKSEMTSGAREIEASGGRWNRAFGVIGAAAKVGVIGVAAGLAAAVGEAISYEQAFAGVIKTTGAAPPVLDRLRRAFREMSTEIPISANELAGLGEAAGALGIPAGNIEEFVRVTALLGKTTNVSADQAATSLGQLSNVLDLTGKDYERFASTLVDLGNKGASTEGQILEIANRAGAVGHNIGLSTPAILGFGSAVANLGIEVEAGGTALQFLFQRLALMLANSGKLKELGAVAGMTGKQFKQAFLTDAQGAIISFLRGLAKLDPVAQSVALQDLGLAGARTSRAYVGLAASLDKNLLPALANANTAWKDNNALQNAANIRFATTANQLVIFKNRMMELLRSLGDQLLPTFATFLRFVNDNLPKAFAYLASVWNAKLVPVFRGLMDALGRVGAAFGGVIDGVNQVTGKSSRTSGLETLFIGIVNASAMAVKMITAVVDGIATLLGNPIVRGIAQLAIAFGAFATAVSLGAAAVGKLSGAGRGLLRTFTFGRLGGGGAAAMDPGSAAMKEAAGSHEVAARELQGAAAALKGAAAAGSRAALMEEEAAKIGQIKYATDIPASQYGRPGRNLNGTIVSGGGEILGVGNTPEARRAYELAGRGIVRNTVASVAGGVSRAVRGIRSVAGSLLTTASNLFWPAMIADIGLEFVKAPLGDFISQNTAFQRAGEQMKNDFFGGLVSLVKGWRIGSDLFVDLPNLQLGKTNIKTESLGNFNLSPDQITALQSGGLVGAKAQADLAPAAVQQLQRGSTETIKEWYIRLRDTLTQNGINTSQIDQMISTAMRSHTNLSPEQETAINGLMSGAVRTLSQNIFTQTGNALNDSLTTQLRAVSGGRLGLQTLGALSSSAYDALSKLLIADARSTIDPRVLAVSIATVTGNTPALAPKYAPPPRGNVTPQLSRVVPQPTLERVSIGRQSIQAAQDALNAAIAKLSPDEAASRQYSLNVLKTLGDGIAAAGKDKSRQATFLAAINRALGLTGEAKMSWADLINWRAQLGRDTGATAQAQLNARMKDWSVTAAVYGAQGGAAEFWKQWGADVRHANTDVQKEALRKKINALIPGKSDDMSTAQFSRWLASVQKQGEAAQHPDAVQSMVRFVGSLLHGDTTDAITNLAGGLEGIVRSTFALGTSDTGLIGQIANFGLRLINALSSLWTTPAAIAPLKRRFHAVIIDGVKRSVPGSPVLEGPLKHPFLPRAGAQIVQQIADGMAHNPLTLPPLDMSGIAARGGGYGRPVSLHAQNLNVLGPADEASITARLAFLANR